MWRLILIFAIGCAEVDDQYYPDESVYDSVIDAGGFDAGAAEVLAHKPKQQ